MLTPSEIVDVADDLRREVERRDYVRCIMADTFAEEPHAWQMIIEVMEVILHRRDLYIVPKSFIKPHVGPHTSRTVITGETPLRKAQGELKLSE